MALKENIKERLYELHSYRGGRVPVEGLRGLIDATQNVQGHNVSVPDFKIATVAAQTGTPSAAILTGTGRIYGVWALSGKLAAAGNTAANDVIVQVLDSTVVVGSFKVKANKASEIYFFDSDDGIGEQFSTSLKVAAVLASDGSTSATGNDSPDVLVIYGDDLTNTGNSNLINTNYG